MLHGETIATLRRWEDRFPVLSWTVSGLHVWPLIRTELAFKLLATGAPPAPDRGTGLVRRALASARTLATHHADRATPPATADAVFLSRPANRNWLGDAWYDRIFDPIADALDEQGRTSLQLEYRTNGTANRSPRHRPAVEIRPAVLRRTIVSALTPARAPRLDSFDEWKRLVERNHPTLSVVSPRWVAWQARSIDRVARYFERLLRAAQARVAFCSVYYTVVGMALCLAARRCGIPSVDVQHGVTAGNPAYEGWTRFPDAGYALLPSLFWCWSDADARPVRAWPEAAHRPHHAFVGGHPWLALFCSDRPLAEALRARVPARRGAALTVLVTLSWSSGFSDQLRQLLSASPADVMWWIRLHPLMDRDRAAIRAWCETHMGKRAEVDASSDLPLPLLLERADVHLTHNSTVVQEATRLGTPSVVIDRRALDVYTEELRSGWAVFSQGAEGILAALDSQSLRREALLRPPAYPSWLDMSSAVRELFADHS